jgi:hypothetical protein
MQISNLLNTALILWTRWVSKVEKCRSLGILYRTCINAMPLPVYIDRYDCYNKYVVSVGTHLNFFITSIIHCFIFLFLPIAGGILRRHISVSMFFYFPDKLLVIQKLTSNSANQSRLVAQQWNALLNFELYKSTLNCIRPAASARCYVLYI